MVALSSLTAANECLCLVEQDRWFNLFWDCRSSRFFPSPLYTPDYIQTLFPVHETWDYNYIVLWARFVRNHAINLSRFVTVYIVGPTYFSFISVLVLDLFFFNPVQPQ